VNDLAPVNNLVRLLKYSSAQGGYGGVQSEKSDESLEEDKTRGGDGNRL